MKLRLINDDDDDGGGDGVWLLAMEAAVQQ